jgi:putative Holliday junction resolvase
MGRVLAVDWGLKRVGVALSDETRLIARPLPTLHVTSLRQAVSALVDLVQANDVITLVIGLPIHMSGFEGESAQRARKMTEALEAKLPHVRFVLWDERLTSKQAGEILRSRKEKVGGRNKGRIDQVAAAVLLQNFLDSESP